MGTAVEVEYATGRRLSPWASTWRYVAVVLSAVGIYLAFYGSLALTPGAEALLDEMSMLTVLTLLDPLVGLAMICLLPLRRRFPLAIAIVTGFAMSISVSAGAAAALATISLATHRRPLPIAIAGVPWLVSSFVFESWIPQEAMDRSPWWVVIVGVTVVYAFDVAIGLYIGARRALIASLHERALEAERERELQVAAAQAGERTRIAREMHDVLAHRISLVAMHAGALAYREDLDRAATRETAGLIQQNARRALAELRQVLGVLRSDGSGVEPPQPTLAQLPSLLDEARAAGASVMLEGALHPEPPELVSRTAYRVVQEALTNARKHAPGAPIRVRVDGRPGGLLSVEVSNGAAAPLAPAPALEGAGAGLVGLAERVELAEGTLEYGPSGGGFVVRALLPWETEEDTA